MLKRVWKELKRRPVMCLGVRRVRQRVKKTHANEAQTHIQEILYGLPSLLSCQKRHGHHNATRNYLGHPCFGKLYHPVATLLEQIWRFRATTGWDRSYIIRTKGNEMQQLGWNPTLYAQVDFWKKNYGPSIIFFYFLKINKNCPHTWSNPSHITPGSL